jgi:hypothetical protein
VVAAHYPAPGVAQPLAVTVGPGGLGLTTSFLSDGLGRTTAKQMPDLSLTTYAYYGPGEAPLASPCAGAAGVAGPRKWAKGPAAANGLHLYFDSVYDARGRQVGARAGERAADGPASDEGFSCV